MTPPRPPQLGDLVLVEWVDATHAGGWHPKGEAAESVDENLKPIKTVGWLILSDSRAVVLAQTLTPAEDGGLWTIPLGMVKSVQKLNYRKRMKVLEIPFDSSKAVEQHAPVSKPA